MKTIFITLALFASQLGFSQEEAAEGVAIKWMTIEEVKVDMALEPESYTAWFKIIFEKFYDFIKH